jgi:adenylate kinase
MNILLLGKPGSGKGTITQELKKEGFLQLSTVDLLRAEEATGSELGKEIAALSALGKFSTDETIFKLVNKFLAENEGSSIIFDGFPRNLSQAEKCLEMGIIFDKVFSIDVSDEKVKERIVNRRVHPSSGRVYNTVTMPPKVEGIDDITGEPLLHRTDDRAEVLDKRLQNFRELTEPIIGLLQENGHFINKLNGESPIDEQVNHAKSIMGLSNKKLKI